MLEAWLYALKPVAPLMVMVAAFLDTFVGTGYLLYGFAMLSSVGMLLLQEMVSVPAVFVAASTGTIAASCVNFGLGRYCSHWRFVQRRSHSRPVLTLNHYLDRYGNWWFILFGRYITVLRPSYGLVLGLLGRPWHRFLRYEIPIALLWVGFWLAVIIYGTSLLTAT